ESVYSTRIRAGKRRTYFFDVRATRGNDYFLTITESRKRFDNNGYDRHKIFLYKEDFNKFIKALGEAVDFVKTDLMPDFDFDAFNHEYPEGEGEGEQYVPEQTETAVSAVADQAPEYISASTNTTSAETPVVNTTATEEVDKW
ncbi:MAG: DNA-binding protein, partial [Chitinophaga sp.]|nr:DNA-binding protein [Chitinophaga sp.]